MIVEMLLNWLNKAGHFMLERVLPVLFIAFAGVLIIRLVMKVLRKALETGKMEAAVSKLLCSVVKIVLYVLLGLIVASGLGIDVTGVVALASVLTLAVSLSIQNFLANVIGGFTLLYTKPFVCGDFVEIAGQSGTVREVGLTYTKLGTADNKVVSIPNSAVTVFECTHVVFLPLIISRDYLLDNTVSRKRPFPARQKSRCQLA